MDSFQNGAAAQWVLRPGKASSDREDYVSLESNAKPGLYISAGDPVDGVITPVLSQDAQVDPNLDADQPIRMTFRTLEGADGEGVRFESVKYPGYYLVFQEGRPVLVQDPAKEEASFYVSTDESVPDHADDSAGNSQREVLKTVRFYTVGETVGTDDIRIRMYLNNGTWNMRPTRTRLI